MEFGYVDGIGEQVSSHPGTEEKVSAYIVCGMAVLAEGDVDIMG